MPALDGWDLERYRGVLRSRAERLRIDPRIGVREDESDLVQETILRAVGSEEAVQAAADGERLAWLFRIQDRVLIDKVREHRAAKRDVANEQAVREALDESAAFWMRQLADDNQPSPSEAACRREEDARLKQALGQLPEREREAMMLQVEEGLTMQQIAERLGVTKAAVAGLVRRGSDRLAQQLGEKEKAAHD